MGRQAAVGERPRGARASPVPHAWFWGLVGAGVLLDLSTKIVAFAIWDPGVLKWKPTGPAVIPGFLYITTRYNPGMAWSVGRTVWWPLLALVTAVIAGYVAYYRHRAVVRAGRRLFDLSLGLVLAGAVGNLVDRILPPHMVRDFIDIWFGGWSYPVFNVADVFIVAGVIGYVWWGWRIEGRATSGAKSGESAKPAGSEKSGGPGDSASSAAGAE